MVKLKCIDSTNTFYLEVGKEYEGEPDDFEHLQDVGKGFVIEVQTEHAFGYEKFEKKWYPASRFEVVPEESTETAFDFLAGDLLKSQDAVDNLLVNQFDYDPWSALGNIQSFALEAARIHVFEYLLEVNKRYPEWTVEEWKTFIIDEVRKTTQMQPINFGLKLQMTYKISALWYAYEYF